MLLNDNILYNTSSYVCLLNTYFLTCVSVRKVFVPRHSHCTMWERHVLLTIHCVMWERHVLLTIHCAMRITSVTDAYQYCTCQTLPCQAQHRRRWSTWQCHQPACVQLDAVIQASKPHITATSQQVHITHSLTHSLTHSRTQILVYERFPAQQNQIYWPRCFSSLFKIISHNIYKCFIRKSFCILLQTLLVDFCQK